MPDIVISELKAEHLADAEHWASHNSAVKTLLKLPGATHDTTSDTRSWVALDGSETVAIATVKLNKEHVGYINCIVKTDGRTPGYWHSDNGICPKSAIRNGLISSSRRYRPG